MAVIKIFSKKPIAKKCVTQLGKHYGWKFGELIEGESFLRYTYFDDVGFEYMADIFIKAVDEHTIKVYVYKNQFIRSRRDDSIFDYIKEDIAQLVKDYLEDIEPDNFEIIW